MFFCHQACSVCAMPLSIPRCGSTRPWGSLNTLVSSSSGTGKTRLMTTAWSTSGLRSHGCPADASVLYPNLRPRCGC